MASPEFNSSNETSSLLETHGEVPITLDGVTLPLKAWFGFCPQPHDKMDPEKINEAARAFLDGYNPFTPK